MKGKKLPIGWGSHSIECVSIAYWHASGQLFSQHLQVLMVKRGNFCGCASRSLDAFLLQCRSSHPCSLSAVQVPFCPERILMHGETTKQTGENVNPGWHCAFHWGIGNGPSVAIQTLKSARNPRLIFHINVTICCFEWSWRFWSDQTDKIHWSDFHPIYAEHKAVLDPVKESQISFYHLPVWVHGWNAFCPSSPQVTRTNLVVPLFLLFGCAGVFVPWHWLVNFLFCSAVSVQLRKGKYWKSMRHDRLIGFKKRPAEQTLQPTKQPVCITSTFQAVWTTEGPSVQRLPLQVKCKEFAFSEFHADWNHDPHFRPTTKVCFDACECEVCACGTWRNEGSDHRKLVEYGLSRKVQWTWNQLRMWLTSWFVENIHLLFVDTLEPWTTTGKKTVEVLCVATWMKSSARCQASCWDSEVQSVRLNMNHVVRAHEEKPLWRSHFWTFWCSDCILFWKSSCEFGVLDV